MRKRIFLAIDKTNKNEAIATIDTLQQQLAGIKLGLEFFYSNGHQGVADIRRRFSHLPLFLDVKLHDIPNTVHQATRALLPLSPSFLTIHASGGAAMIAASKQAVQGTNTKILAVTLLTSLGKDDVQRVMGEDDIAGRTLALALLAKEAGADGVVCSPLEIATLRAKLGKDFIIITPGIRATVGGINPHDQKRVATPKDAIMAGADYLVMGRGILEQEQPESFLRILNESLNI